MVKSRIRYRIIFSAVCLFVLSGLLTSLFPSAGAAEISPAGIPAATPEEMARIKKDLGFDGGVALAYQNGATPGSVSAAPGAGPVSQLPAAPGDGTLRDTVLLTLNNHPVIKAFQENRIASEFDIKRARSGWFPRIDLRGGFGVEFWHDDATRRNGTEDTWYSRGEASAVLTETIWDGLATYNRVDQAQARRDSVDSRLFDNAETLAFDAVMAHLDVLRQRELVRLCELNVKQHENILASQRDRVNQGSATSADVTQTEGRLARSQSSLVDNVNALAQAEAAYIRLTNSPVPATLAPAVIPQGTPETLEAILAESQAANPKIEAMKADVVVAQDEIELAKSAFHPYVFAEIGPNYKYRIEGSQSEEWGTAAMLRMNWNILNGGYDYYNVRGATARMRQAKQELMNQIDQTAMDSRSTWAMYQTAIEQARLYMNAVKYNLSTRDAYLEQFDVGQRSLLDLLDAENELFSSSLQEVTARLNVIATQYRLLALEGKLIKSFEVEREALRATEPTTK